MEQENPNDLKYGISVSGRVPEALAKELNDSAQEKGITLSKHLSAQLQKTAVYEKELSALHSKIIFLEKGFAALQSENILLKKEIASNEKKFRLKLSELENQFAEERLMLKTAVLKFIFEISKNNKDKSEQLIKLYNTIKKNEQ